MSESIRSKPPSRDLLFQVALVLVGSLFVCIGAVYSRIMVGDAFVAGSETAACWIAALGLYPVIAVMASVSAFGFHVGRCHVDRLLGRHFLVAEFGVATAAAVCAFLWASTRQQAVALGVVLPLLGFLGTRMTAVALRQGSRRRLLRWGALGFLFALLVQYGAFGATAQNRYLQENIVPELGRGRNFLIVGIDGLDWTVLSRMAEQGRTPTLAKLMSAGAAGPLHTMAPTVSPFLWNTIYTGYTPAVHNRRPLTYDLGGRALVTDTNHRRRFGLFSPLMRLFSSSRMKYPLAFWDVLARAGYQRAVIGSWENGGVLEEGVTNVTAWYEIDPQKPETTLNKADDLDFWATPELLAMVPAEAWSTPQALPEESWRKLIDRAGTIESVRTARHSDGGTAVENRMSRLSAVYASDLFRFHLSRTALGMLKKPRVVFSYLRGVDVTQHYYAHTLRGARLETAEEGLSDIVAGYYAVVDGWVAELLAAAGIDTTIIILSDHGINLDELREDSEKTGFHDFAPDGVLIAAGPGIMASRIASAHILDIAPTVLALAGFPTLADMEGRVLPEICSRPVSVFSWSDLRPAIHEMGDPRLTDETLNRQLRALGYVE